jgi:preprotein translocase subunit YajC
MFATLLMFAEDAAKQQAAGGGDEQPPWFRMLPFIAIGAVFLFLMMRSSRRQDRERQSMLATLEKNDKVLTVAEIYGTVISVDAAKNEVVVKVDDNTRMKMTIAAIKRNITKEEAAAAPKADGGSVSTAVTAKPNS